VIATSTSTDASTSKAKHPASRRGCQRAILLNTAAHRCALAPCGRGQLRWWTQARRGEGSVSARQYLSIECAKTGTGYFDESVTCSACPSIIGPNEPRERSDCDQGASANCLAAMISRNDNRDGGSLAAPPSHTTVHTGPYTAVHRIEHERFVLRPRQRLK
jgi:hypothetical protein